MRILMLCLGLVLGGSLWGQVDYGGSPFSSKNAGLLSYLKVDTIQDSKLHNKVAGIVSRSTDPSSIGGYRINISKALTDFGAIEEVAKHKVYREKIYVPDAESVLLYFDKVNINEEVEVFVYDENKSEIRGKFSSKNVSNEKMAVSEFRGNVIIVEVVMPVDDNKSYLRLKEIGIILPVVDLKSSGNCNVNVNCPEGDDWQCEKKGVARIHIPFDKVVFNPDGTLNEVVSLIGLCSGSLVNNTSQDGRSLFLTADHCLCIAKEEQLFSNGTSAETCTLEADAISNPLLDDWIFYFNYERRVQEILGVCVSIPFSADDSQTITGASLLSNNFDSDFALLELNSSPVQAGYDVYFNGWSRTSSPGLGGVGIHHPVGDVKKISTHTITPELEFTQYIFTNRTPGNYFQIPVWDSGVTEGGSSGSPLFDENKRIIGQLLGGDRSNCDAVMGRDTGIYGKIEVSWDISQQNNKRRLSDWLDPLGIDPEHLDGSANPTCMSGMGGECTEAIEVSNFEQVCLENGRYRFRFNINAPFSRYRFSSAGTDFEFDVSQPNQVITISSLIIPRDQLTVNFEINHFQNGCGLSFSHTFQEECENTCNIELVNSRAFCTSGENEEFLVALRIDDKRAIGVEMRLRDNLSVPITSRFIDDDQSVVVGPYPSGTEVFFTINSQTTGCSETFGPFTQLCPDPCTITANCLMPNAPMCTGAQTFSVIPSFDGEFGVAYTITATNEAGVEFDRVENAVPDVTSEDNLLEGLPTTEPVIITARETNSLTCPVDVETISFFPPFNPTPSTSLCASSDRFSIDYVVPTDALLPAYQFDDGINPPVTVPRGQSFYEAYPSGTTVTITMSDPANPDCATVSQVITADCGNPPVDPCAGANIVNVGQADCTAGTVAVTISGDPSTSYTLQEILNGNNNNATAINVLGGNTAQVPFNADGSGLLSFSLRYAGQPVGEECDREVGAQLVCTPSGPGGGAPNDCNTEADPATYSLYWPYPENSMFLDTNCGRGLTFGCGAAGSCGTQGYSMTVSDGCGAHWGNDFYAQDWSQGSSAAVCDDNFYAPMDGTVIYIYDACAASCGASPNCNPNSTPYGNEVVILSSDGNYALRVGHLNSVTVTNNAPVFAGQLIGTIGNTGNSFGAHIHAALYQDVNDASGGSTFVQRLRNGELFGVSNGSAATANAQDFEFDCTNSIEVITGSTPGDCIDPGSPVAIEFRERGTLQQVFVEFCPTDGSPCQTAAGGDPFVLNNMLATDTWTLNTSAPSAPGDYTIKIYDQNNTVVQASSAFPIQVTTDCGTVSLDCLPPASVSPQANASGTEVSISWPGVAGAASYRVEVKTTDSNNWTLISTTTGTTAGFISQTCTGYDVRVASNCTDGSRTGYTVSGVVTAGCTGPGGSGGATGDAGGEFVGDCPGDNDDDDDPVFINCPPNQTYVFGIDNADECEAYVNWSVPVAVDNCNVEVTFDGDIAPGTLQPVGNYTVTYVAEDNNDNNAICSFTVIVEDPQTLQFTNCPTETLTFGTDPDLCAVTANWSIPVATDNCNVTVSHVSGPQPGDELAPGIYQVVYEATNNGVGAALETATCSFFVQVIETQNPELNCPQDVFVESDPGVCEAAVENIQLEFAFDNCPFTVTWTSSPADVTGTGTSTSDDASGAIFPVGITTVTYRIMENDDFGNGTVVATCDLIVEVTDTEAPEITCPPSVVIGTDDDGAGNYDCATDYTWNHPTPTDNCAVTVYELTYTNPDGSVEGPLDWGAAAGAMVSRNFALGVTTILYHVEDAEGNVTECSWTVEVIDDEDPMIFCEENLATNTFSFDEVLEILPRDTVSAIITVPVSATIADVNIPALAGGHPDMGDVAITLTSPAGTTITLFDGLCGGTTDFDLTLDDSAGASVNTAPCSPLGGGGNFAPADALAAFNGENSQGDWTLTITSQLAGVCGNLDAWELQIVGNDNSVPPVNRLQVIADAATCTYFLTGMDFDPRFTDNCEGAFITHDYLAGPFDTTLMGSSFPIGETEILWTVTDAAGNTATCPMIIEVLDNEAPRFTNCARPDIIANPTPGVCDAFVNFSLPLATDNCGDPAVTINQIDGTGLTTGMRFPVGTTILMYEALDVAGNRATCEFRVIVNDNQGVAATAASCPEDVVTTTDTGDCVAVVNGLTPTFDDNCGDNLTIVYKVEDETGTEIASGFDDPSGEAFPLGTNTVSVRAQDQPVFLITEVTHEIQEVLGGNDVIPGYIGFRGLPDGDYLELTNFGAARLDVSGLDIERLTAMGIDHFRVPAGTVLEPGETLVLQFGNDDPSPADNYFVIACATDLSSTDAAAYVISHSGRVLDVVAINGFDPVGQGAAATVQATDWSGSIFDGLAGIRRASVYDDNAADDFVAATVCGEITIGAYNPDLAPASNNGGLTSMQARKPNKSECDFTVTVTDEEPAVCGSYAPYNDYEFGQPVTIAAGDCFEATIDVAEAFLLADVNTTMVGTAGSFGNLRITLISPEGDQVVLADNECATTPGFDLVLDSDSITQPYIYELCSAINSAMHLRPRQDLNLFHNRPSAGTWTLQIAHDATEDFDDVMLENWTLSLSELLPYAQQDTTIENDFRECGADFTWLHTGIWDNCPGGSVEVTYLFKDTIQDSYAVTRDRYGRDTTRFFDVGITTVRYTLTDANGNVSTCSFDLTVLDTEPPVLVCPADTTLFLAGGECDIVYIPTDWFTEDNCGVVDTLTNPFWEIPLPIGINPVDLTTVDSSGNSTTCTYVVTVVEYDPPNPQMACVGDLNVSLGSDCEADIVPSMLLTGDEYYCFDNYEVTLLQEREEEPGVFDTLPVPVVGEGQIGDTLIYQVYDPRNDILCWGYLRVGFFEAPEFVCPDNTTITCNGDFDPALNGEPVLLSCALSGATVSYADTLEVFDACDDPRSILRRTWLVEDNYGNAASCVQTITMEAFDLDDIVFPADLDGVAAPVLTCFDVANDPSLTDPQNTGFPTVIGGGNVFQTNFCSASYYYSDRVFDICAGSYEIVRTWEVRSTCGPLETGVNPIVGEQLIRVLDQENPLLVCPANDTISTGGINCSGEYAIPVPVVEESCSSWTYEVTVSSGTLSFINGNYYLTGLLEGSTSIEYLVEDECGRRSSCIYFIYVTDLQPGNAACEDQINVSLDGGGLAYISPDDIDNGSADLCSAINLRIRKQTAIDPASCTAITPVYGDWTDEVAFNCCEVNTLVKVELEVTDEDGNASRCWTDVLVEDKQAPACLPPPAVTVNCNDLADSLPADLDDALASDTSGTYTLLDQLFGAAGAGDNCGGTTVTQTVTDLRESCGVGEIFRRFTVTDAQGLSPLTACTQTITVVELNDYVIAFPADAQSNSCELPEIDTLSVVSTGCDLIIRNITTDTFPAEGEECYLLRVNHEVINWCEYNTDAEAYVVPRPVPFFNEVSERVFLHVVPGPTNAREDDVALLSTTADILPGNLTGFLDIQDEGLAGYPGDLTGVREGTSGLDGYGTDPSRGYFIYHQFISVFDDVAPVIEATDPELCLEGNNEGCSAPLSFTFTAYDECSSVAPEVELDENYSVTTGFTPTTTLTAAEVTANGDSTYTVNREGLPVGEHALRIRVSDGCGNSNLRVVPFCVEANRAPAPICIQTLTVTIMPDGQGGGLAELWAADVIASDVFDCFGNLITDYSIYREADAAAAGFTPAAGDLGIEFDCFADVGAVPVRVYAFDANGLSDYCSVMVEVQLFADDLCDADAARGTIAGTIVTAGGEPVEHVEVDLENGAGSVTVMTGQDGVFSFGGQLFGIDYTVTPDHRTDYLNGVRTSDIVGITQHILGIESFTSAYQMIAADVDGNAEVNVGDIINIRRLILGLADVFPNDMPSWLFVNADYAFPSIANPWIEAFPTVANYNDLALNELEADFIGVKLGDVNGTAVANSRSNPGSGFLEPPLELEFEEQELIPGQEHRVHLSASTLGRYTGFQGALRIAPELARVTAMEPGLLAEEHFMLYGQQGIVRMSWNTEAGRPLATAVAEPLLSLVIVPNQSILLSDLIDLYGRTMPGEAYTVDGESDLMLVFDAPTPYYRLWQNVPNPFTQETSIVFELPASAPAEVSIRDFTGRVVASYQLAGRAGRNMLKVNREVLSVAGVYTYTVSSGEWLASKRMIVQ